MAKQLIELAQEVCDRTTVACPTTLFGTNDTIARRLRTAAKDTLRDIMRRARKNGVSGFTAQWVFATKPGVYAYPLPPDFYKMVPNTEQRQRWPLGILGPVSPQTWSNWVSGLGYSAVPMGWRIKNNLIHLEPPPGAAEIVVIEYLSRFMVARDATDADLETRDGFLQPKAPLVPREGYVAPGALPVVDVSGAAWGSALWGASVWSSTEENVLRRVPASGSAGLANWPAYQVRAEEFTADTDTCALDDDYIVSLGMTWRYLRQCRRPYAEEYAEYKDELDTFLSRDASIGRDIYFGDDVPHDDLAPLGDGKWIVT